MLSPAVVVLYCAVVAAPGARPPPGKGGKPDAPAASAPTGPSGPPPSMPAGRPLKVAILELGALGVSSDMMRNLEMLLRSSLSTIDAVQVISPLDVQLVLQDPKNKDLATCGGGPVCAQKIGALIGVDVVIFGTIGALGQAFNLNVRAIDVATGKERARQQTSISGNRDLLIPEMRLAAFRLIAPDRIAGSLLVEVDVEGVEVEIDGKVVGTTPLAKAVEKLAPGPHLAVLRRPGITQFQQEFTVKPFETAKLKIQLKKPNEPK